jgi:uncharacterized protein (UPF0276 family)
MNARHHSFASRLAKIPPHGLGLSVDVYTPDLVELAQSLDAADLPYGYLEVFRAPESALKAVRRAFPGVRLAYHGEGLWMTQPDWETAYPAEGELSAAAAHLAALGASWINHECASKQLGGYSFGTYLPPLFTDAAARVTARHVRRLQDHLDRSRDFTDGDAPLVLMEIPPLTYFGFGDLSVPAFFRRLVEESSCGLVLDIGHVWTIYRYSMAWRRCDLSTFLSAFLDDFPMEHVVQIHLAGLGEHEGTLAPSASEAPPRWIDAHAEPISGLLLEMLEQVLAHPRLTGLRGVALEVDTKSIRQILEDYARVQERFGASIEARTHAWDSMNRRGVHTAPSPSEAVKDLPDDSLGHQYRLYAETVSRPDAAMPDALPAAWLDPDGLQQYRQEYLPHEIMHWGGDLEEMFPRTCRDLQQDGKSSAFVAYWFREPRCVPHAYDFFLLKVDGFVNFIAEALPASLATARREAQELRTAYRAACMPTDEAPAAGVATVSDR